MIKVNKHTGINLKTILFIITSSVLMWGSHVHANPLKHEVIVQQSEEKYQYTGEIIINGDIVMDTTDDNISSSLNIDILNTLKSNYIIFHEIIWEELPEAKTNGSNYRIDKTKNGDNLYLAAKFDSDKYSVLGIIHDEDIIKRKEYIKVIDSYIRRGIVPSLYVNGVTALEIENMKIKEVKEIKDMHNTFKVSFKFRGKEYESFVIFTPENNNHALKIFSITSQINN